jgi:hypothetical protein
LACFLGAGLAGAFWVGLAGALGAVFFFAGIAREVGRWIAVFGGCRRLATEKEARSVDASSEMANRIP